MSPSGCVLALDIGEKRVGIAVSDRDRNIAFPVSVLPLQEVVGCAATFMRILDDYKPALIVIGLPISLVGEENAQALRVRDLAQQIERSSGVPYEFFDERLSSSEAKRRLREQGVSERQARGSIDKIAASLFLQTWLDLHEPDAANE